MWLVGRQLEKPQPFPTVEKCFLEVENKQDVSAKVPSGDVEHETIAMSNDATAAAPLGRLESRTGSIVSVTPGQPTEQLQVEERSEREVEYPSGPQLWLNLVAMMLVCFLHGLDLTIVAPIVHSITNEFKTASDIGWYSAVYGVVLSATNFFFGKLCTLFDLKRVYIASVTTFELGSVFCTFAPTSNAFIVGRAIAGMSLQWSMASRARQLTSAPPRSRCVWLGDRCHDFRFAIFPCPQAAKDKRHGRLCSNLRAGQCSCHWGCFG